MWIKQCCNACTLIFLCSVKASAKCLKKTVELVCAVPHLINYKYYHFSEGLKVRSAISSQPTEYTVVSHPNCYTAAKGQHRAKTHLHHKCYKWAWKFTALNSFQGCCFFILIKSTELNNRQWKTKPLGKRKRLQCPSKGKSVSFCSKGIRLW